MAWARIIARTTSGDETSEVEFELGCDEAAYPDQINELVAGVLRMYGTTVAE